MAMLVITRGCVYIYVLFACMHFLMLTARFFFYPSSNGLIFMGQITVGMVVFAGFSWILLRETHIFYRSFMDCSCDLHFKTGTFLWIYRFLEVFLQFFSSTFFKHSPWHLVFSNSLSCRAGLGLQDLDRFWGHEHMGVSQVMGDPQIIHGLETSKKRDGSKQFLQHFGGWTSIYQLLVCFQRLAGFWPIPK